MRRGLERLKEAQEEDVQAGRSGLLSRLHSKSEPVRQLAAVVGAIATLAGPVRWLYDYIQARRIPPAELPATGQPTVATDRVEKVHGSDR